MRVHIGRSTPHRRTLLHGFVVPDSAAPDYPQFSEWRSSSAQSPYGLDAYSADSHRCAENAVRGVTVSQNRIAGKFGSAWSQMLVFSIPFDAGWKATVDGSNVPLRRIDYGLTGLEVGAGEHAILLRYRPPMLTTGQLVSLLGVLALAGAGILSRILRKPTLAQEGVDVRRHPRGKQHARMRLGHRHMGMAPRMSCLRNANQGIASLARHYHRSEEQIPVSRKHSEFPVRRKSDRIAVCRREHTGP